MLAIMGVILYGSMSLLVVGIQTSQLNSTVATMDALEKALLNFRMAFGRLPCPADITLTTTSANYGVEAANTSNTCSGSTPAANYTASGAAEGGVPTRALRLPDSYMYDGWGHKFRYAVSPIYTGAAISSSSACTGSIAVNDVRQARRAARKRFIRLSATVLTGWRLPRAPGRQRGAARMRMNRPIAIATVPARIQAALAFSHR